MYVQDQLRPYNDGVRTASAPDHFLPHRQLFNTPLIGPNPHAQFEGRYACTLQQRPVVPVETAVKLCFAMESCASLVNGFYMQVPVV